MVDAPVGRPLPRRPNLVTLTVGRGPDVPTRANGQPAFGYYVSEPGTSAKRLNGLMVLTIVEDHMSRLTRFGPPDIVTRFGLPLSVPAQA